MIDCGFQKDNAWFRYRSGALIVNDDKMLFVKCKFADYYYIIGGGVHHGEISADLIKDTAKIVNLGNIANILIANIKV